MEDIIIYNDVKSEILRRLREMVHWNNADTLSENVTKSRVKRAQQENAYLEYIASYIVDLPMPD